MTDTAADQIPEPLDSFRKIDAAPKESKDGKPGVHEEAMNRWKHIVAREEESRVLAVADKIFVDQEGGTYNQDTAFLSGDPATNQASGTDDDPPPPRYQIDRITPVLEEAVSDQREAQIQIQVRPTSDVESGLADTFNGLIKNIESTSDAEDAYDGAFDEVQKSGYGGWQIVTRYEDDSFEQEIGIEPVLNATQSLFFGPATKATKEDALYAFHIWNLDKEEFNAQHPDEDKIDWPTESLEKIQRTWFNRENNTVRMAAYWRKRPVKKEIVMLSDLRVVGVEDLDAALKDSPDLAIELDGNGKERRRTVDTYEVERFIMNGVKVLKGPQKWLGKFIPLIPEYGVRSHVDGHETIRGKVRKGKDAQQIYNYVTSAIVETGALSPKDFHWMTAEQAEGHMNELERMNVDKNPIQFYTHIEGVPPPVKGVGPTVQQALIEQRIAAKEDIHASVGAGVGVEDGTAADPRSGEAIIQGNVNREKGNSIYFANHKRAITYTGIQLTDLIAKLWTTQRQRRIIQPDGTVEFVSVNETKVDLPSGTKTIINDLTQAAFDVAVDVGPAFASQRQQGAEQLTGLAKENEAFAQDTPDLIAKNLDIPGSDELHKRLRRRGILNGTIEPTDDEREEFNLDQREQIIQEVTPQIREQVAQEANIRLIEAQATQLNAQAINFNAAVAQKEAEVQETAAKTEKTIEETENVQMDSLKKAIDANTAMTQTMIDKLEAGLQPTQGEIDNLNKQDDLVEDAQQDINPGASSALETEIEERTTEAELPDETTAMSIPVAPGATQVGTDTDSIVE